MQLLDVFCRNLSPEFDILYLYLLTAFNNVPVFPVGGCLHRYSFGQGCRN